MSKCINQSGAVLTELALSATLMVTVLLGFAQLYMRSIEKMDHYALATQAIMGPQAKTMTFDSTTGVFSPLGTTTNPTSQDYLTLILDFLEQRAPNSKYAFYLGLGYVNIEPSTGIATGYQSVTGTRIATRLLAGSGDGCQLTGRISPYLTTYADEKLNEIYTTMTATPTTTANDNKAMGLKLYDFYLGDSSVATNRKQQYAEIYPYVFLIICSNNTNILYPQPTATFHVIAPRRHIN